MSAIELTVEWMILPKAVLFIVNMMKCEETLASVRELEFDLMFIRLNIKH